MLLKRFSIYLILVIIFMPNRIFAQNGSVYILPLKNINLSTEENRIAENYIINNLQSGKAFTYFQVNDLGIDSASKSVTNEAVLQMEIARAENRYTLFARLNHRGKKHLLTAFKVQSGAEKLDSLDILAKRLTEKVKKYKNSLKIAQPTLKTANDTIFIKNKPSARSREDYAKALNRSYFRPSIDVKKFFTAVSGGYPLQAGLYLKWYFYERLFLLSNLSWFAQEKTSLSDKQITWDYFPLTAGIGFKLKEFRTYPLIVTEAFIESEQLKSKEFSAKALRINAGLEMDFLYKRNIYCAFSVAYSHFMTYSTTADEQLSLEMEKEIKQISAPLPSLRLMIGYNFE